MEHEALVLLFLGFGMGAGKYHHGTYTPLLSHVQARINLRVRGPARVPGSTIKLGLHRR